MFPADSSESDEEEERDSEESDEEERREGSRIAFNVDVNKNLKGETKCIALQRAVQSATGIL